MHHRTALLISVQACVVSLAASHVRKLGADTEADLSGIGGICNILKNNINCDSQSISSEFEMLGSSLAQQMDEAIANFFSSWNIYTTILALGFAVYLVWPILAGQEPDVHPFLLARQAQASPIRHEGQSAVYRAVDIPYGYPLRAGLGVKDPGAPKWSAGRNGDIRDVWRQAARGPLKEDGTSAGPPGKIVTVLGREKTVEHNLDYLTNAINVMGKYIQENRGTKVAVCLSNSAELLTMIFGRSMHVRSNTL